MTRATIPDYSYWNGAVNFQKAKDNGAPGVILRASWGMYPDTMFQTYRNQCEAIKLPWAAYHYYDFRWSLNDNLMAFENALAGRFGFQAVMDLEQDPSAYQMKAARALLPNENPEQALDVMPFTGKILVRLSSLFIIQNTPPRIFYPPFRSKASHGLSYHR